MTPAERNRVITRSVAVSLIGIVAVYTLYLISSVIITVYISSLLAIGLSPAVRQLERSRIVGGRRMIPRWLAILLLYVAFLAIVGIIGLLTVPPMVEQAQQLIADLPQYSERFQAWLRSRGISAQWSLTDLMSSGGGSFAISGIVGFLGTATDVISTALTVILLPFYLLLESSSLHMTVLRMVKPQNRSRVDRVIRAVTVKVAAWLGGQMLLALIIGGTATLAFWWMGVPYFSVLGLLAAIGEMIPVIGPILACIPAIALGWTVSPKIALFVGVYTFIQQMTENNVLVPRIMERQVGISAATILVAMLTGTVLFGFVGAILAIPTAAIIQIMIDEHIKHEAEEHFRREAEAQAGEA
jgi:predicted PurR-regulated permease PerM